MFECVQAFNRLVSKVLCDRHHGGSSMFENIRSGGDGQGGGGIAVGVFHNVTSDASGRVLQYQLVSNASFSKGSWNCVLMSASTTALSQTTPASALLAAGCLWVAMALLSWSMALWCRTTQLATAQGVGPCCMAMDPSVSMRVWCLWTMLSARAMLGAPLQHMTTLDCTCLYLAT